MTRASLLAVLFSALLGAQSTPPPPKFSDSEQDSLRQALGEAGNSPVDFVRALELHLQKYPNSPRKNDLERALVKGAMEIKDNRRIVLYGERVLEREPDDVSILERVSAALLQLGGQPEATRALKYAQHLEEIVRSTEASLAITGREAVKQKDDHDRALARSLIYQARANGVLDNKEAAIDLARKSYGFYPSVEAAREASHWLALKGQDLDAVRWLAKAFSIGELKSADSDREQDRQRLGELYRKLNGSEKGLGDIVLEAYDETNATFTARHEQLRHLDVNAQVKDALQFTLTGLQGDSLKLSSLQGKVVVLDFWATWCGPCRVQHPLYEQVKQRFKERDDVAFLAIDADDDRALVKPFLESQHWSQKVYFDDGLQQLLQVSSLPTTIILNKRGETTSRMAGFLPERFVDMLTDRIREALGPDPKPVTHASQ